MVDQIATLDQTARHLDAEFLAVREHSERAHPCRDGVEPGNLRDRAGLREVVDDRYRESFLERYERVALLPALQQWRIDNEVPLFRRG